MRFRQVVAKNVRRLRHHHGWTQRQLAERLQCHKQTVWAIEAGRQGITDRLMDELARTFEVDFHELVRRENGAGVQQHEPPATPEGVIAPAGQGAAVSSRQRGAEAGYGFPAAGSSRERTGEQKVPGPAGSPEGGSQGSTWPMTPEDVHALIRQAAYEAVRELMREYRIRPPDERD